MTRPPATTPASAGVLLPEAALRQFLARHLPESGVHTLVVALSGGLDSRVLLHALARVAPDFPLAVRALHVHHGLSPNADAWAVRVQEFCAAEGVACALQRVQVAPGASRENAAREARQGAFRAALAPGEALLLAQHRDDQAETVLFRLLRGAGLAGLGGMRADGRQARADGGEAPRWRPFLGLTRAALAAYATARGLAWVDDESNADTALDRNFLRHDILPRLRARWPAVTRTLADTALRLQEAEDLLRELAEELAEAAVDAGGRLRVDAVRALPPPRQRLLLRHWLQGRGFRAPDAAVLERVRVDALTPRVDATPRVAWADGEVRRYRDHLYAMAPLPALPAGWSCRWEGVTPLALPDGRRLALEGEGAPPFPWQVRFREGGERLRALPGAPSRELRTWLQEQGVPPWERERLPLVFAGDTLIAVGGLDWPAPRPWRLRLLAPA